MGRLDPVTLSVLASALAGIAEEMGAVLIRGSYSSNIKERRDCSTALFDSEGRMVAQAEHIPVHLGAMPEAVAAIMGRDPEPGDVFAINDPYSGGTHLPDVTLVSPVAPEGEILGYAVTRAHHSDVGGMRPGSAPSDSREIFQEGIIIPPVRLVQGGEYVEDVLDLLLANVRTPAIRRGDLRAQIAANNIAEERVGELIERRGKDIVLAAFDEVISYAEKRTREAIRELPTGEHTAEDHMEGEGSTDEDIRIKATVTIKDDSMTIDFAGTADTSNRIADAVLSAFSSFAPEGLPAQGQGTMNNTIIGGPGWTYYETIGGGQGANNKGPGPSGVHVGMSNPLNTPTEAFELEYPMRVERYELLYGSGGAGKYRGGDGIVRSVKVLEPASLSLLTDRRRHGPRGVEGGEPGRVGHNLLNDEDLAPKVSRELEAGDVVTVETPGGGGYGRAEGSR